MKNWEKRFKYDRRYLIAHKNEYLNGKIEGMNSKLRRFTKRAFGFNTIKNLKITIFIAVGKFNLTPA